MAEFVNENASSNFTTLWDSTSGAQLRLGANGSGLSIGMWIPRIDHDGTKRYPKELRSSVNLTPRNTEILSREISDKFSVAYEAGENCAIGVQSSKLSLLQLECMNGDIFLHLHKNLDPSTNIPQTTFTFKFDTANAIGNFDKETGQYNPIPVQADFYVFTKAVSTFADFLGGSICGHGVRQSELYRTNQFLYYVQAIAKAVQAKLPENLSNYTIPEYGGNVNGYNSHASTTQQVSQATAVPVSQVDSIAGLIGADLLA